MTASSLRPLTHGAAALLGDAPTLTLFDRAAPSTCLTVRLVRRGATFEGTVAGAGLLVERLRMGVQPSFFCAVAGTRLEGELEVRLRDQQGGHAILEVGVTSAAPVNAEATAGSIPRT
ncbi:MAG: hypothetical protein HYS27_13380 [Deltaproteobacteria bacterium]|nr:hypothetical protein [Deltaproteobacteria bacterium]